MTDSIDGWITTIEAARVTGYHIKYIRQMIRAGRIEARKVGRDWLVNLAGLLAYKAEMERLGTQKHNPWRDRNDDKGGK
jgi:excisionase family DNA binding protein